MGKSGREILQSCKKLLCSDFWKTLRKISQLCPSPSMLENGHEMVSKQQSQQRSGMMDAVPFSNAGSQGV